MNVELFCKALAAIGANQRQFSLSIGMSPTRLSDMIHHRLKGYKYQRRISQALGVPQEELFPEDGNKETQESCQI